MKKTGHFTWLFLLFVGTAGTASAQQIVADLDTEIHDGPTSLVYCASMQLMWDGLKNMMGGPILLEKPSPLLDALNKDTLEKNVVPAAAHVSMAGTPKLLPMLNNQLAKKFGANAPPIPQELHDTRLRFFSYTHLYRELPFPRKFIRRPNTSIPFEGKKVQFFGVPKGQAVQYSHVRVPYVDDEQKVFTVRLATRVKGEVVVLSMMEQPETLRDGIELVREHLKKKEKVDPSSYFGGDDLLIVPLIDFKLRNNYPELAGQRFRNPKARGTFLGLIYQSVALRMDESGVVVKSTAAAGGFFGGPPKPRKLVFDKPFMLTIWNEGAALPYVAVWVASADILSAVR